MIAKKTLLRSKRSRWLRQEKKPGICFSLVCIKNNKNNRNNQNRNAAWQNDGGRIKSLLSALHTCRAGPRTQKCTKNQPFQAKLKIHRHPPVYKTEGLTPHASTSPPSCPSPSCHPLLLIIPELDVVIARLVRQPYCMYAIHPGSIDPARFHRSGTLR